MKYSISFIPPQVLDIVEDDARRLLADAVEASGGRESLETIFHRVITEECQLWIIFGEEDRPITALVTRIENYSLKRMLNFLFIGGAEMGDWLEDLLYATERFAREHGCEGFELVGRPGWKKVLKKLGWTTTFMVCERTFEVQEDVRNVA